MKLLQKLKELLFGRRASHVRMEKEYCVMPGCGRWTGNYKGTPIKFRRSYHETQGDLCDRCAFELISEDK